MIDLTHDEILYLETILERLQGTGESATDAGDDCSQSILDKLEEQQ